MKKMKKHIFYVLIIFLSTSLNTFAQIQSPELPLFIKDYDLKLINIDQLSDDEISKIVNELEKNNMTFEMLKPLAVSNGLSEENFEKLQNRILSFLSVQDLFEDESIELMGTEPIFNQYRDKNEIGKIEFKKNKLKDEVFGSELFRQLNNSININSIIPPTENYVIGPGDDLQINIYGVQQLNVKSKVLLDGNINIPNVGYIPISGLTIENATKKLNLDLSRIYTSLRTKQSNLSINIIKVRTVNITVTGSINPGVYTLSAANSIYDALQIAGGPANNASFRNIELIRNGKVINTLDLYEFMISPNQKSNITISNNDVIRIPTYKNQIRLRGEVKRPGVFELKDNESLSDLIKYASGFTSNAFTNQVKITQKSDNQFRLEEVNKSMFNSYFPKDGDIVDVGKILNKYKNRVSITGAVYRPGFFSLTDNMKVSDLIIKSQGLIENANAYKARILRIKDDFTRESLSLNLKEILNNNESYDIYLENEDIIEIFQNDIEQMTVELNGKVFRPGSYIYYDGMTLGDLILSSGGLLNDSSQIVELARRPQNSDENVTSEIFDLDINSNKEYKLKEFDVINVREKELLRNPQFIRVEGEVKVPGFYAIKNFNSDIQYFLNKAKGLSKNADENSIKIIRKVELKSINTDSINNKLGSISIQYKEIIIPIEMSRGIIKSKVVLKSGDILRVEKQNFNVSVSGEVQLDSEIPYKKGANLNYYIKSVGGKNKLADISNSYVIYPNGRAKNTKTFLFFKNYPKISEGSQIVVPTKLEKTKVSVGELIGYTSALSSVAAIIISLIK